MNPGWIVFKGSMNHRTWHRVREDGTTFCKPYHVNLNSTIDQWRPEPTGKWDVCSVCRKRYEASLQPKEAEVIPIVPEPEVLSPSSIDVEDIPVSKQPIPFLSDKSDKRVKVAEAAQLIGRAYNTVYRWVTEPKFGLHYDRETKTIPQSDLDRLDEISKERPASDAEKTQAKAEKPVEPAKEVAPKPAAPSGGNDVVVKVPENVLFAAAMMRMTPEEFINHCVDTAVNDMITRLQKKTK
jgi:hypothetical protein